MDVRTLKEYETLSPFEIKDFLIKAALNTSKAASITYLNAGRGNPNWIATEPREAFFLLGQFAITESQRLMEHPAGLGGMPEARGIANRLAAWLSKHAEMPGATSAINVVQRVAGSLGTALLAVVLQRTIATNLTGFHGGISQAAELAQRDPGHAAPAIADAFGTTFWVAFALTAAALVPALLLPSARARRGQWATASAAKEPAA